MTRDPSPSVTTAWLLGAWQLLRCDAALDFTPGTRMHFHGDATLDYRIPTDGGVLQAQLRWHLDGGVLHTDLVDGSNPVQVGVVRGQAEVLEFDFAGARAWFVREAAARA